MNSDPLAIAMYLIDHPNVKFIDGDKKEKRGR
jgi:hypothetical protein